MLTRNGVLPRISATASIFAARLTTACSNDNGSSSGPGIATNSPLVLNFSAFTSPDSVFGSGTSQR